MTIGSIGSPIDVVALASDLLAAESVTPATGAVFDVLDAALSSIGFAVDRLVTGTAPDGPVENLLAVRGSGAPHFAFAGHLDVVPPGEGWTTGAFEPAIRGNLLHGRGAVDMKGAVAAFAAAASRAPNAGTLSLVITGDEEGAATFGTPVLIERMRDRGLIPDLCLVGEPTSAHMLGDTIKIGRRGSVNVWIEVYGRQGHVAYPHLADNPIPRLVAMPGGDRRDRPRRGDRLVPALEHRDHRPDRRQPCDQRHPPRAPPRGSASASTIATPATAWRAASPRSRCATTRRPGSSRASLARRS